MAIDERKRQKKLEKKRRKDQAERTQIARQKAAGIGGLLARVSAAPIHECLLAESTFDSGMGVLMVSRKLKHGDIAFSHFLLDVFCLGVKDANASVGSESDYDDVVDAMGDVGPLRNVSPEYARKLVDDLVDFAKSLGFSPHPDFRRAYPIFQGIDGSQCKEQFEFGLDGVPTYFAGPRDAPERVRAIMAQLEERLGPGNFGVTGVMDDLDGHLGSS